MTTTLNNYLCHTNTWYWGTSIKIVHKKGIGIICVKLDDDYPSTAFICDLSVFELNRKQGIGRELMKSAWRWQGNTVNRMPSYMSIKKKIGLWLGIPLWVLKSERLRHTNTLCLNI